MDRIEAFVEDLSMEELIRLRDLVGRRLLRSIESHAADHGEREDWERFARFRNPDVSPIPEEALERDQLYEDRV